MKSILISQISLERSPFVRAAVNSEAVQDYAELYRSGTMREEPVVFVDEAGEILLADGRHRIEAAQLAGMDSIKCQVERGGFSEALKWALTANSAHGLRRTNADKKVCVIEALKEWPRLSNPQVAELCAVTDRYVTTVRRELESSKDIPKTTSRICSDGRTYSISNCSRSKKTHVGTENEQKEKPMAARKDPQHDCMWVPPEPPPVPRGAALALFEHAFRLLEQAQRNEGVAANPLFNKAVAELRQVRVSFQSVLPGILDQVPAVKPRSRATVEELKAYCVSVGLPAEDGAWFFDKMEGAGWKNGGQSVKDAYATIRAWKAAGYMASQKRGASNGHHPTGADKIIQQREYERVVQRMTTIKGQYEGHQSWDSRDKAEFSKLRDRRDTLKTALGVLV